MNPKLHVLILENNLFFVTRLDARLRGLGHTTRLFASIDDAMPHLTDRHDAAIVDLHAPGAMEFIRVARQTNQGPVIAFCGHMEVELRQEARASGAAVLLPNSELIPSLDAVLRRVTAGAALEVPIDADDGEDDAARDKEETGTH